MEEPLPRNDRPSFWLARAADALDCAVQCGAGDEANEMEERCDQLADELRRQGR